MRVVDPWDWLDKDGSFLVEPPRLYRRMLRIARFIEYGGPLQKSEMRETLIECVKCPKKVCLGLMWVVKTEDHGTLAHCMGCGTEVHNWQGEQSTVGGLSVEGRRPGRGWPARRAFVAV